MGPVVTFNLRQLRLRQSWPYDDGPVTEALSSETNFMGNQINKKINCLCLYRGVNKARKWILEYRSK